MKKLILLVAIFFVAIACGQSPPEDENAAFNPENILIDVRSPQEYEAGHIKNAVNIPVDKAADEIRNAVPDQEKTIVIYCKSGRRSAIAENILKAMGYKNIINAGGYESLKRLEHKGS
ncbi:MAG: rhodanese-like domain-containing protein [Deltaproteobacteria bacterium]|nr:rhodanese-like domain-containing protein [Deltaproteobacteria bacterium]